MFSGVSIVDFDYVSASWFWNNECMHLIIFQRIAFFSLAFLFSENPLNFVSRSTLNNLVKIANTIQKLINHQMKMFSSQKLIKFS